MLTSVRHINQKDLWHARLDRVHKDMIKYMSSKSNYQEHDLKITKITDKCFDSKERELCSTCAIAKLTRLHSHSQTPSYQREIVVHHNRYIIIFVDSSSRMILDY